MSEPTGSVAGCVLAADGMQNAVVTAVHDGASNSSLSPLLRQTCCASTLPSLVSCVSRCTCTDGE